MTSKLNMNVPGCPAEFSADLSAGQIEEDVARDLVERHAAGNVNLQFGSYLTEADVAELRACVLNHDFHTPPKS